MRAHLRSPPSRAIPRRSEGGSEWRVDLLSRESPRGRVVPLSAKEFELLVYLMRHPNQALSREQLLSGVWGFDFEPQTNVVEVYVGYLRRSCRHPTIRCPGTRSGRSDTASSTGEGPGGLRPRLTLLVAGVVALSLAAAFAVVYARTSAQLDAPHRAGPPGKTWTSYGPRFFPGPREGALRRARAYLDRVPFRPTSRPPVRGGERATAGDQSARAARTSRENHGFRARAA